MSEWRIDSFGLALNVSLKSSNCIITFLGVSRGEDQCEALE